MDTQFIISIILLVTIFEVFAVILFVKYRRGNIEENPFITVVRKEWMILFYSFFKWKPKKKEPHVQMFHYHKGSLYFWLFLALLHEQVIEGIVFHIYLKEVDPLRANILLVLHVYSILYMLGDYNLVRNNPIKIIKNNFILNIGVRRSLTFHAGEVETIQPAKTHYHKSGGMVHEKNVFHVAALPRVLTRIFGVTDELKYEIIFKKPLMARGYFGQKKVVNKALIYMDDPQPFIDALRTKIEEYHNEVELSSEVDSTAYIKKRESLIDWKAYFTLLILNVLGALAISPYAIAREQLNEVMGLSKWSFTLFYALQVLLEAGILLFLALWIGKKTGVKIPVIESFIDKSKPAIPVKKRILQSSLYGSLAGIVIILFSLLVSEPLGVDDSSINEPAWWLGILGSFGAAVNEESVFRLFLVTFIIWLLLKVKKGIITPFKKWFAICASALIFGIMHYSMAASNFEMTIGLFVSMLIINGIGGIVFGALYLYAGIEFAMIAHFTADITIHVIGPVLANLI
ncbi:CPBP family intramembrane metalloprotease [Bacillus salacetis]|uniref:CPBP family intramembrane metalloprotease n=1 Tax=Bacillus salacetis TaxID=2315464 RepID=A0A3A1QZW3_9BACI|nr:CPBP family intramembrane glutamic endopeptidase [Bacillus salacetis]RIW31995.1 CPBP family intramembrane metalloprotease [Bacillus salacetis]